MDPTGLKTKDYGKFHQIAGKVKTVCAINQALKRDCGAGSVQQWAETQLMMRVDPERELLFNIADFTRKSPGKHRDPLDNLLSIFPSQRQPHDVQEIKALLCKIKAFERFPDCVQHDICKAAIYQQYEANRTVFKQGQRPQAFYFVLSGSLQERVCQVSSRGISSFQTVREFREGDVFGDLSNVFRNFLQVRYDTILEELSNLPLFSSWSAEKLLLLAQGSLLRFYRSREAILFNNSASPFMVVVISGRCQLMTNLRMPRRQPGGQCQELQQNLMCPLEEPPLLPPAGEMRSHQGKPSHSKHRPVSSLCVFRPESQGGSRDTYLTKGRPVTAAALLGGRSLRRAVCDTAHGGNSKRHSNSHVGRAEQVSSRNAHTSSVLFLRMGILEHGDILVSPEWLGSESSLSLNLMSEGTECIFIPVKLFLKGAPARSLHSALRLVNSYPTESMIREGYAVQQAWSIYKAKLVRHRLHHAARSQSVSGK
ncbi:cyclic nucleotide-binding domain-containing protein 2-like isoform X3 [Lepisosteus oculatus]|uniref:cyclic nucleotide-binding domain-containing protein 2-like isoform X3 n=1 Tax=Lepisosteus oculatus TaxID=7918 RepID=UPI0035F51C16